MKGRPEYSGMFPPFPAPGDQVLCAYGGKMIEGIVKVHTEQGFGISFSHSDIDAFLPEEAVMPIPPDKNKAHIQRNSHETLLNTLAMAAEISPRHNGDVATLSFIIHLLQRKQKVIESLTEFHDKAEEALQESRPLSATFKEEYAKLLLALDQVKKELRPHLIRLRTSQERSPFRCLPKRLA